jgi:hypothetical protein
MVKKKAKLTKKQMDILYECWKNGDNTKERLALIEQNLPRVPSLTALSIMRRMARTDTKWLKMATRKKNQQEKEKLEKKRAREKKKAEAEKKRAAREEKKKAKTKQDAQKRRLARIRKAFGTSYLPTLEEKIEPEFFFCPSVHQYVHNLSCIFRIFSDEFNVSLSSGCDKCSKMDKFISIIEEIIKDGGQGKTRRHKASKSGGKAKTKKAKKASKTRRKTKSNK